MLLEIGNRMPDEVKVQFRRMLESDVTIPSLSHYVKYVNRVPSPLGCFLNLAYTHNDSIQVSGCLESWGLSLLL